MRKIDRWARVRNPTTDKPIKLYPRPDYRSFLQSVLGMAVCLVAIHWIPDLAIWIYANLLGETLVIDERAFKFRLVVAYVVGGLATTIGLVGLAWAAWHLPEREAYEAARKARMNQGIDLELSERLNEKSARQSQGDA